MAAATTLACVVLLTVAVEAAHPPQLQMAQPTLVLPSVINSSDAAGNDVLVEVRLLGPATKPVTARLSLLLPPVNGTAVAANASDGPAWAPADPDELWLEPTYVSWTKGEATGAKHVRLRSAAELPLSVVLEDSLYAPASVQAGEASASSAAQGQPLLKVELVAATGAAIDKQRSSTTLVLEAEEAVSSGEAASTEDGLPLFGFVANQAAYPPNNNNSTSSGEAGIPVRLLAGQLSESATLKYIVRLMTSIKAQQQFLPTKASSGFLTFQPTAAPGNDSAGVDDAAQQEQLIRLPLVWERIPPEAEYRLGLELAPLYNSRVQPQPDAVALHIFGTALGTCPPGSALRSGGSGLSIGGSSIGGPASPITGDGSDFAEAADFGLFLNGSVIDLSSGLEAGMREYAAMVESDVESVMLCLHASSTDVGAVQVLPMAGKPKPALLDPEDGDVAASACGCEEGAVHDGTTCAYTAWRLPLGAGQNQFAVMMPATSTAPSNNLLTATPAAGSVAESSAQRGGDLEQYTLAVVRLADPEHAELQSIKVTLSDDTGVLLCGPPSARTLPSRAALEPGTEGIVLPAEMQPCVAGKLLSLNVSETARLLSLTPTLSFPDIEGVRVEVNGQVLSRGGDVAADQRADTTAAQQARANAAFLPSAFIINSLLPGSHLDTEVVVVAEDGVTSRRYPIRFTVVEGGHQQQLAVAEASGPLPATDSTLAAAATGITPRRQGWPMSPAHQPFCAICPAGWAASAANSTACGMCPPGTFAPSDQSPACHSCAPGTFAYSWGSSYCKNCIEGTYAPKANSSLCLPCPANLTTRVDGRAACEVPLIPGSHQEPRYAVVVSFWVMLTGVDPAEVVVRAGVNAAPEDIVMSLIRTDTARQFNISIDDVQVDSVRQVARRTLTANVTATLGVDVPAGATDEEVAAALEVERLSADQPIEMLSSDPDRFFGRTTKTLEVQVQSAVEGTSESVPGGPNLALLWGLVAPGILAILAGSVLVVVGCRKSPACAKWRGGAARRLATSRLAPRALAYSRYSGSSVGGSDA